LPNRRKPKEESSKIKGNTALIFELSSFYLAAVGRQIINKFSIA